MGFIDLQIEWNPWLGSYCPQIHVLSALSSTEFVEPPQKKIPGYATVNTEFSFKVHNNNNGHQILKPHWLLITVCTLGNQNVPNKHEQFTVREDFMLIVQVKEDTYCN
jgi:mannose-6-phosphate isomerase class I